MYNYSDKNALNFYFCNFSINLKTDLIKFNDSIENLLPLAPGVELSIGGFLEAVIAEDKKNVQNFLSKYSDNEKSIFFTMSLSQEKKNEATYASVFASLKFTDPNSATAVIFNISRFMPGGHLYKDLKKLTEGLPEIRALTHDLNNQFQIITGFGSALQDEISDPELKEFADNVVAATQKAIECNNRFRQFLPPKSPKKQYLPDPVSQTKDSSRPVKMPPSNKTSANENDSTNIMVVDDEPMVQKFLCHLLKRLNYTSTGFSTGAEAISSMKKRGKDYRLAIMDMNLPDIECEELYSQLKNHNKELKVILISGDNLNDISKKMLDHGASGYLQKPTTVEMLSQTIKKALAG
jgi:CheY-like chemotaxis protein